MKLLCPFLYVRKGRPLIHVNHRVQFYESDDFLVDEVAEFIYRGMRRGEGALVVATNEHRAAIEDRLRENGVTPISGQHHYYSFAADETLARFMVMGAPDPKLFREIIGSMVVRATPPGKKPRVFGEMVALLWDDGNRDAALQLEGLWNDLAREHPFSLLCGYHLNAFKGAANAEDFQSVCDAHDEVCPSERYHALGGSTQWLRYVATLEQRSL